MAGLNLLTLLCLLCGLSAHALASDVFVTGHAVPLGLGSRLGGVRITALERDLGPLTTDASGYFEFPAVPGEVLTLVGQKTFYKTIQLPTFTMPATNMSGPMGEVMFQMIASIVWGTLQLALPMTLDSTKCHVIVTVSAFGKTAHDVPQGEVGARSTIGDDSAFPPFYFGAFKLGHRTNPWARGLTSTSEDGGVLFANVEPRDQPYTVSSAKDGVAFTDCQIKCRPGAIINGAPPIGNRALNAA